MSGRTIRQCVRCKEVKTRKSFGRRGSICFTCMPEDDPVRLRTRATRARYIVEDRKLTEVERRRRAREEAEALEELARISEVLRAARVEVGERKCPLERTTAGRRRVR